MALSVASSRLRTAPQAREFGHEKLVSSKPAQAAAVQVAQEAGPRTRIAWIQVRCARDSLQDAQHYARHVGFQPPRTAAASTRVQLAAQHAQPHVVRSALHRACDSRARAPQSRYCAATQGAEAWTERFRSFFLSVSVVR